MGDCLRYKPSGDYAGAEDLLEREWALLKQRRPAFDHRHIRGLAFSGGGIRSASFCLGVAQALADADRLRRFDYLSTVSGGGYIGGALSWLWSRQWLKDDPQLEDRLPQGLGPDDFPFGTRGRRFGGDERQHRYNRAQASLMRHLRQNGKYLTPGHGITGWSLLSIILRSLVMGFVSLMVFAGALFGAFYLLGLFRPEEATSVFFRGLALWLLAGFLLLQLLYMGTIAAFKYQKMRPGPGGDNPGARRGYRLRRFFEIWIPRPLVLALLAYLMAAVHWLQLSMLQGWVLQAGSLSVVLGAVSGVLGAHGGTGGLLGRVPARVKVLIGAALMLLGLMVLADWGVDALIRRYPEDYGYLLGAALLALLALAALLPINTLSIHRYYRDRLMEAFMPDPGRLLQQGSTREALRANQTGMHELAEGGNPEAPYHLINANVVLVESSIAKFRGRGGDNFIISPLYSGSNATGWIPTRAFCGGAVTLPTAVAISGAAANPNAGVAGKGLSINPLISVLMSVFNLRLGYWVGNPDHDDPKCQKRVPSYLWPGFWEVLFRKRMNERARFVQLSDGGHFENLAVYELFRRRARVIVVCDAAADPGYGFADLANALEKARVDFGISVELDRDCLQRLVPVHENGDGEAVAERGWVTAEIDYHDGRDKGVLVYIKTTFSRGLSAELYGYRRAHPTFPDESTGDQFFDEVQFEAYRELGWQLARQMLEEKALEQDPLLKRAFG